MKQATVNPPSLGESYLSLSWTEALSPQCLLWADGALGFWAALRELGEFFKDTKEQRCWVHRIVNVLDCFPKRLYPQVKLFCTI